MSEVKKLEAAWLNAEAKISELELENDKLSIFNDAYFNRSIKLSELCHEMALEINDLKKEIKKLRGDDNA